MSNQMITSTLLVDLSADEQQFLSGGRKGDYDYGGYGGYDDYGGGYGGGGWSRRCVRRCIRRCSY
ncbi:hypothetical protein VB735_09550 [Halotia wernerae UHCC 0503]|nr:hypothetical protein [Halotia wernerae UHCC 0503]